MDDAPPFEIKLLTNDDSPIPDLTELLRDMLAAMRRSGTWPYKVILDGAELTWALKSLGFPTDGAQKLVIEYDET